MALQNDASTDWKRYGQEDPYFGVLGDSRFRGIKNLDTVTRRDFFASGRAHAETLIGVLAETFGEVPRSRALDFGCGVGRTTEGLARHFDRVIGLDVAPGMLAEARRNAEVDGVRNVEYHSSLDPAQLKPRSYDLVHSYIVLQHIPVDVGEPIIAKLIESVCERGIGALHMTILPATGALRTAVRNMVKRNKLLRVVANIALRRGWNSPAMEMNLYRTERIVDMLHRSGIDRFSCIHVDDWGSTGLFFVFRRPAGAHGKSPWSNPVRAG